MLRAEPLLNVIGAGGSIALILGASSLAELIGVEPGSLGLSELHRAAERARYVRLLAQLAGNQVISRIIYFGDDGVLARLLGEKVLDVYGSRGRMKCSSCGYRWWYIVDGPARCPQCGGEGIEDYVPSGAAPRQKLLAEAVYEATTADAVLVHGIGSEAIPLLLALIASKHTRVYLLEPGNEILESLGLERIGLTLTNALEAMAEAAARPRKDMAKS
ncbi:hypothetical protein [Hyperthermus butylicus]|uniref:Uncharacterized protein n=1 Tax=Hyperthermus butylicus (strain DSM 5456 / JCM 9403 / PLM1-5) TaxID=415426 RepID=A2BMT5_HYPBU|nr:hypothetical protein [Hyperthermus butylicus]ABM81296.1 hypothetical protein Hbut_1472 [Hyperthermus butylicus DSM 5456]